MPKRNHAGGENDAPDTFTPATKAAINKHGWTEVQFAHKMGRLRFMEGIGSKIAAEITLHFWWCRRNARRCRRMLHAPNGGVRCLRLQTWSGNFAPVRMTLTCMLLNRTARSSQS